MTQDEMFEIYRLHASLYIAAARIEVPETVPADAHRHPEILKEIAHARRELATPAARLGMPARATTWLRERLQRLFSDHTRQLAGQNIWNPDI